jgi:hypothetical protein
MLLFTPRNLYQEQSDAYIMFRQVGMEYYNCANDSWIQEMAREYLTQRRKGKLNFFSIEMLTLSSKLLTVKAGNWGQIPSLPLDTWDSYAIACLTYLGGVVILPGPRLQKGAHESKIYLFFSHISKFCRGLG